MTRAIVFGLALAAGLAGCARNTTGVPIVVYDPPGVSAGDTAFAEVSLKDGEPGPVTVELLHQESPNKAGETLLDAASQTCTVPPGGYAKVPVPTRSNTDGGRVTTSARRTDTQDPSQRPAKLTIRRK